MNACSMKVLKGSFDEGATKYNEIDRPVVYNRVLRTWAKRVDKNVNSNHTTVFFSTMSPLYIKSLDWDNPDGINVPRRLNQFSTCPCHYKRAQTVGFLWLQRM